MELKMDTKLIFKENVVNKLYDINSKKIIYISSSHTNLEYYNSKLKKEYPKIISKFLTLDSNSISDLIGTNLKLIDFLSKKEKGIIFLDLDLSLRLFFDEYKSMECVVNKEYKRENLINFLIENSYKKTYNVEKKGDFSVRGDIIDIFPSNLDNPIRLDFFDTILEEIKLFDVEDQRSFKNLNEIKIYGNELKGIKKDIFEMLDIFKKLDYKIIIENEEILDIKLEHILLIENQNEETLRKRYDNLKKMSLSLNVVKNENIDYNIEIAYKKETLRKNGIKYSDVTKIKEGDYIIHIEYGIGIFKEIIRIENRDYLYIQYADNDKLYVPIEKLNRISKYVSSGKAPLLYSLGTKGYKKKEKKMREEIISYAKELVEIQAKRLKSFKKPYERDSVWQEEFENNFIFPLTMDQKKAINDIKRDLESGILMDRLLVGDVGFGKTEIALRAAFKAIENGDQCVMLVPTTVLANQHFERCKERFSNFGIRVESLSRLSGNKTNEIIKDIENGKIDFIIATHKILNDNIKFKNLGLLIIDEEQKFGVKAKEKLKKIKADLHLLSLSATPIPRTLNLALLGIRDFSLIETSPQNRLPIITKKINEKELKKVILDEILRDGQIFYITNNVKEMPNKKEKLKKLLPNFINISYINGKLAANTIKQIITDFEKQKFDILIASTIIENGIDIQNANTIIIEKYESLGLSQIYQLRGRVGRGKRQAFCYLLEGNNKTLKQSLKEESLDRIEGIKGAGYKLSLDDLEIRGAGEILGEKQHGAIDMFGYDLYLKMLKNAMDEVKGEEIINVKDVNISFFENGYIPEKYIEKEERLLIYKRYAEVMNISELKSLNDEIKDRFGRFPLMMKKFIRFINLKIWALENDIDKIIENKNNFIYYKNETKNILSKKSFEDLVNFII